MQRYYSSQLAFITPIEDRSSGSSMSDVIIGHVYTFLCLGEWSCTLLLSHPGSTSPPMFFFFFLPFFHSNLSVYEYEVENTHLFK